MFDIYNPILLCPKCGGNTSNYQGKCGPNGLFIFQQGHDHPVDMECDEQFKVDSHKLNEINLPQKFILSYGTCNACGFSDISAIGFAPNGVWNKTIMNTSEHVALQLDVESVLCQDCNSIIKSYKNAVNTYCDKCKKFLSIEISLNEN